MERCLDGAALSFPVWAVLADCCGRVAVLYEAELDGCGVAVGFVADCCASRLWRRMQSLLPAASSMRRCWACALRFTAGARKVGDTEVSEDHQGRRCETCSNRVPGLSTCAGAEA